MEALPSFWRQLWTLHSFFDLVRIGLPSVGTVTMILLAFIIESYVRKKKGNFSLFIYLFIYLFAFLFLLSSTYEEIDI